MKKVFFVLLVVLSQIFYACDKEKEANVETTKSPANQVISALQKTGSFDGSIYLIDDFIQTKYQVNRGHFSFQGTMPIGTNYSQIIFNNYPVPIVNRFFSQFSDMDTLILDGNLNHYFGADNDIVIDNILFVNDFYVPSPIIVDFTNDNDFYFEKQNGISFNLDVDKKNTNSIVVLLQYDDDNLPEGGTYLTKLYLLEPQTASFTIPAQDLTPFPTQKNLILYVGCGSAKLMPFNNHLYDLEGINITRIPHIQLY